MIKNCIICSKEFETVKKNKKMCSKNCQQKRIENNKKEKWRRNNPLKTKKCNFCGEIFKRTFGAQNYCSDKCREKQKIKCHKEYNRKNNPLKTRECVICKKNFKTTVKSLKKTCCKECSNTLCTQNVKKWKKENPEYTKRPDVIKKRRERDRERFLKPEYRVKRNKDLIKKRKKPKFRIDLNISNNISRHLKSIRKSKNGRHWEDIVGYTKEQLMEHLEKQFKPGMTWDNYGRQKGKKCWEIDHIIPKSFFVYTSTDDVEFKYCWSLNNLQPLWALDNWKKGNKIIGGV